MPTTTIPLTTVSIQQAKATKAQGSLAAVPMRATSSASRALMRAALTAIPANAVVSSATLQVTQYAGGTGANTLTAAANLGAFSTRTTYNSKPGTTVTNQGTQTRTAPAGGSVWSIPLTALVQSWVSGSVVNNGVTLTTSSNTAGSLRGQTAASGRPVLVVDWAVLPAAPTGLHPSGGVVSKTKPTLTFGVGKDVTAIQVQIDPAANGTTPGFDSGEVASTAGLLDLSTTSYAGLAAGTTYFQARVKNALGWSPWSGWVQFSRVAWGTTTVTSPGSVSEDPSPPVVASYSGTLTSWRVLLVDQAGRTVEDSGWRPGATIEYGPTASVGSSGTAVVQVRDNVQRIATPGDPDYLETRQTFTVTPSGVPAPVVGFSAAGLVDRPWVQLTGSRSAMPDEVIIYRNDVVIYRGPGFDLFTGQRLGFVDYTAPLNVAASYSVRAVVNGQVSDATRAATITPTANGIWLADPTTGAEVVIWGDGDVAQEEPEVAVIHTPIGGATVRRRLARAPGEGSVAGTLIDVGGIYVADCEAALTDWIDQDAGHTYRLVLGNRNDPVILGNIQVTEVAQNGTERIAAVSLDWWRV